MIIRRWIGVAVGVMAAGCGQPPNATDLEYELTGQVLAVDQARQEVTIKHEDIPAFMPGMTMTFKAQEAVLLAGRVPGDLVAGTLVVSDQGARLKRLERTGSAPVAESAVVHPRVLEPGEAPTDTELLDQTGSGRRLSDWRGYAVAVTFTYTRCPLPDFCPLLERHFTRVQNRIREEDELRESVRLLSVTVDPRHDTPGVLAAHAAALDADPRIWTFLTGSPEAIRAFTEQFGVSIVEDGGAGGEVVHNLRTAVIDTRGHVTTVLGGNDWDPAELLQALRAARQSR